MALSCIFRRVVQFSARASREYRFHLLLATAGLTASTLLAPTFAQEETHCVGIVDPVALADLAIDDLVTKSAAYRAEGKEWSGDLQRGVIHPYLNLVDREGGADNWSDIQKASVAELIFRGLRAGPARVYFKPMSERDDLLGAVALVRMAMMNYISDRSNGVATIEEFQTRFEPTDRHLARVTWPTFRAFQTARSDEQLREAGALLLTELEALPATAPFKAFDDAVEYADELRQVGMEEDAKGVMKTKLRGLKKAERALSKKEPPASEDPILTEQMPFWHWRNQGFLRGESFHQGKLRMMRAQIAKLEEWLDA